MWFLFHRNAKTRTVRDGHSFVDTCPDCRTRATFVEVEVSEKFGLFFVDLVGDTERAYRCTACGEVFDRKDQAPAASPPARPQKTIAEVQREQAAEQRRRREAAEAKAVRIEDELADLKKRLGR